MSERRYDPKQIEPKWQELWAREGTWEVSNEPDETDSDDKSYVLEMLPYPSGEPHIGHLKNYALGDAIAHFHRRTGHRVLHPMGYDAFGLPAENNAIKTGVHPREATNASIDAYRHWFHRWGISIDWTRELGTHEPPTTAGRSGSFCAARARPRLPQGGGGQVVPARPDGARQRAGDRRPLRAVRQRGRGAPAGAVVLPDHRLRRPAAGRPRQDRLARARQADAAQLDRSQRGRGGHVPLRGARDRLRGVHHPSRHAVRGDVLRHGTRASRRVPARRRAPSTSRRSTSTSTTRSPPGSRTAARSTSRRPAPRSAAR